MDSKELFINMMYDTTNVALATCAEGKPNVRAVSIGYDKTVPDTFYFTTFPDSAKAKEIQANPTVTVIPFPNKPDTDVTIRINGTCTLADITLEQHAELIRRHLPEFAAQLPAMKDNCAIYQVKFSSAEIALGMAPPAVVMF
ncbi:MAG: pyridoxamine 5'-phosphate oxidase family protein [Lachnospiraceae bacterium]